MNKLLTRTLGVLMIVPAAVGVGGVVAAEPAEAAWRVGYHYSWNQEFKICYRVNHMRSSIWDVLWNRYYESSTAVPARYCDPVSGTWV